jgi:glutamate synthase (ferredoxin)
LDLQGDTNDYLGKGMSGGRIVIRPPQGSTFEPSENIIVGNVAFYGATRGEAYLCGVAGERFCVRNSGVTAVIEGVGDHGCEYMTGGTTLVLGPVGRNFAAGMSGGIAYVLDEDGSLEANLNSGNVSAHALGQRDEAMILKLLARHVEYTGSPKAKLLLERFAETAERFVKILPNDYAKVLDALEEASARNLSHDESMFFAYHAVVDSKKKAV